MSFHCHAIILFTVSVFHSSHFLYVPVNISDRRMTTETFHFPSKLEISGSTCAHIQFVKEVQFLKGRRVKSTQKTDRSKRARFYFRKSRVSRDLIPNSRRRINSLPVSPPSLFHVRVNFPIGNISELNQRCDPLASSLDVSSTSVRAVIINSTRSAQRTRPPEAVNQ